MPTRLPRRRPAATAPGPASTPDPAPGLTPSLASAWLAGLILLAAILGSEPRGACAVPTALPAPADRPVVDAADAAGAALGDMLAHD